MIWKDWKDFRVDWRNWEGIDFLFAAMFCVFILSIMLAAVLCVGAQGLRAYVELRKTEMICEVAKQGARIELQLNGDILKNVKILPKEEK